MSAEKCEFCGEFAVIEDSLVGATEQKICIECGCLASISGKRAVCENLAQEEETRVENRHDEAEIGTRICTSCGEDIEPGAPLSLDICSECAQCESEEPEDGIKVKVDGEVEKDQDVTPGNTGNTASSSTDAVSKNERSCNACGSFDVQLDQIGTEEKYVCRHCGVVVSSMELIHDFVDFTQSYQNGGTALPKYLNRPRKLKGLAVGKSRILFLQQKFFFPEEIKVEALEMFTKVYYMPGIFLTKCFIKEHVAAACVYIVCRLHDFPVSVSHFRKVLESFPVFMFCKRRVLKSLNMNLPPISLSTHIGHSLAGSGLGARVISRVRDILFLCRRAWLTEGKNREGLITIGAYFAFVSSDSCPQFVSIKQFIEKFKLPCYSKLLYSDCRHFFLKLAKNIPWVPVEKVKLNNFHLYIDDILKYQSSLIQLAFRYDGIVSSSNQITSSGSPKKRDHVSEKELLLPSSRKRMKPVSCEAESVIPPGIDLDSTELESTEFEEEINSYLYLLSPEEKESIQQLKVQSMDRKTAP